MSLEIIDKILSDWEDPNYTGLDDFFGLELCEHTRDDYMKMKTRRDIEQMKYIKSAPFKISTYNNLHEFYEGFNFTQSGEYTYKLKESNKSNYKPLLKYVKNSTRNILEIGFGSGEMSLFLLNEINADITSLDYYNNIYSWYGKSYIDEKHPERHNLLIGLPEDTINIISFGQPIPFKYDLVLIDLDNIKDPHTFINKIKDYSHENTNIIFRNICPHINLRSYLNMKKMILEGILNLEEYVLLSKIEGISVMKFGQGDKLPRFKDIEAELPMMILMNFIKDSNEDKFSNNSVIQIYIRKLMKAGIKVNKEFVKLIKQKFNINI